MTVISAPGYPIFDSDTARILQTCGKEWLHSKPCSKSTTVIFIYGHFFAPRCENHAKEVRENLVAMKTIAFIELEVKP